jgi:hypothetical protein
MMRLIANLVATCVFAAAVGGAALGQQSDKPTSSGAAPKAYQALRYMRVTNITGQKLQVFVRFCVSSPGESDAWMQTADKSGVIVYDFEPGESAKLVSRGEEVAASKVRIWAVSPSGKTWNTFKERDLVIVDQPYPSDEIRTFTFAFNP